jgi:hypothetical protein
MIDLKDMNLKGSALIFYILLAGNLKVISQSIMSPNYGLKSPETLNISKIEITPEGTTVYLTVENRIENGNFCADRNIFIIDPAGNRLKLSKASGIPVCPDKHKFKKTGEKLDFTLSFPPLKPGIQCIDIKEECSDNCFSFYGVVLNKNLNKELDGAYGLAESGQSIKALDKFISLSEVNKNSNGIEALIFFNIIKLATETGNTVKAAEWYKKLNSPDVSGGRIYIEQLNLQGIRY